MATRRIMWTRYMQHRLHLRSYDQGTVEDILRYSSERYFDSVSGRLIAIGHHRDLLVMVPYDQEGSTMTPVTIHATTRQQINSRLKSGRFSNE